MSKLTFAIAGLGGISSRHINAIEAVGGKVVATYDPDPSRGSTAGSFEELLKSKAEYVVLLTPNCMHKEQARQALDAGKGVVVEKPPVMTLFDVGYFGLDEPIYAVSQLRYMESIKNLRRKVMKDKGYDIRLDVQAHREPMYLANWRGDPEWSGGLLPTIAIHYFDVLTWIFGGLERIDYIRWLDEWHIQGRVELEKGTVHFNIGITSGDNVKTLTVGDEEIDLAAEFFELHEEVYKDVVDPNSTGVHPTELSKALELIDKIYDHCN
jgi:UDP-N-acetyl-2-amino-2-deoxyglucuronate dehydrogenase